MYWATLTCHVYNTVDGLQQFGDNEDWADDRCTLANLVVDSK